MTIDELKAKVDKGEELSENDRTELFAALQAEFEDMKQKDPARYLELVKELTRTFSQLRKDIAQNS